MPASLGRLFAKFSSRSLSPRLLFLRDIYKEMAQSAGLGSDYEFLTRTPNKSDPLTLTDDAIVAKAQYLNAVLLSNDHDQKDADALTYRFLRSQTTVPATRVRALMRAALTGGTETAGNGGGQG